MWVGKPIHLTHQPVVSWVRLQNFWLTIKWAGLGSLIFNPAHGEPTRISRVGSLWHVYFQISQIMANLIPFQLLFYFSFSCIRWKCWKLAHGLLWCIVFTPTHWSHIPHTVLLILRSKKRCMILSSLSAHSSHKAFPKCMPLITNFVLIANLSTITLNPNICAFGSTFKDQRGLKTRLSTYNILQTIVCRPYYIRSFFFLQPYPGIITVSFDLLVIYDLH